MKPLKNKVSITLDSDIIEKIRLLAEKDDRSFSQYINLILKEYLNQKEAQVLSYASLFSHFILFQWYAGSIHLPK